jgi:hypothetical protein
LAALLYLAKELVVWMIRGGDFEMVMNELIAILDMGRRVAII